MERPSILSGNYPESEANRRMKALEGNLYSFNESEFRSQLKSQNLKDAEVEKKVEAEREKIRKANERVKAQVMEEEQEKAVAMLEKEMEERFGKEEGGEEKVA